MPWSAEYLVVPVRRRIGYEPRVLHPANELADRDLNLQPRERAAEADVDAAAVADVLVVLAFEINLVRACPGQAVWRTFPTARACRRLAPVDPEYPLRGDADAPS